METTVPSESSPPVLTSPKRRSSIRWSIAVLVPILAVVAAWWFVYRPIANGVRSENNLKLIMVGMWNHHDTFGSFPNGYPIGKQKEVVIKPSIERFSWRVQLLPFIGHVELFNQFRFNEPWDSPHNLKVASNMPDVFRSRWDPRGTTDAGYLHIEDQEAAFPTAGPIKSSTDSARYSQNNIREIIDGTGETIGVIEVANSGIHWTKPTDITMAEAVDLLQYGQVPSPGTAHIRSNAALVGMMDGSVRRVPNGIPAGDAKALITRCLSERIDYAALGWQKPESR